MIILTRMTLEMELLLIVVMMVKAPVTLILLLLTMKSTIQSHLILKNNYDGVDDVDNLFQ